jgi:hypothetical protein
MKLICFGVAVLCASSFPVIADESHHGWYAGAGAGVTSYNSSDDLRDDSDSGITGFGGYRFNQHLAVQGNFASLGEYLGDGSVLNSVEISGISFTAVGILPVGGNGIELFGRLGLGILDYTQNFILWDDLTIENSSTGDAIVSALGISYTHPKLASMSFYFTYENYYFETERPYSNYDDDYESNSVGLTGLGARYHF